MEFDDEWITKIEDPYMPQSTSWMDIHERFEEEESSKKRKRGTKIIIFCIEICLVIQPL